MKYTVKPTIKFKKISLFRVVYLLKVTILINRNIGRYFHDNCERIY